LLKNYILVQRRTITNNFQRFLDRISAETSLEMDYFGTILLKWPNVWCSPSRPPFRL